MRQLSRATAARGGAATAAIGSSSSSNNNSSSTALFAATQARYHSSSHREGQQDQQAAAAGRLRDALEQYRAKNYSREIPSRFKREISSAAAATATSSSFGAERRASDRTIAVEGIEAMLRNIGVFGGNGGVTREDVETVVANSSRSSKAERI